VLELKITGAEVLIADTPASSSAGLITLAAARAIGRPPESLTAGHHCLHCGGNDHGLPFVAVAGSGGGACSVSFSRAAGFEIAAARAGSGLGIDIESVEQLSLHPVDDVLLHPRERTVFGGLDESERRRYVAHLWVAKEAHLKVSGRGLRADLDDVEVRIRGSRAVVRSRARNGRHDPQSRVTFFELSSGVVGAIAFR